MKVCMACGSDLPENGWNCSSCGHRPVVVDGIVSFAPELSDTISGFDPEGFANLEQFEPGSFWFNSRNALILHALRKYASEATHFLEIGCGTGYVLTSVADAMPALQLTGSELHVSGLAVARRRLGDRASFLQLDARCLPYREEFDVVGVFDVLEHIAEDEKVLAAIWRALHPGGILLATVPQHPALWSKSDEIAHHVRRYRVGELDRKVRDGGFSVLASTSFVTLLFPAMVASRKLAGRPKHRRPGREMRLGPLANHVATFTMTLERALIVAGVRLPFGGSRLLVAQKPA